MANDYSLVILVGRLTRDPELHYSASGGLPYARLSLAVNRSQPQPDGTVQKSVSFIDVTVWRTQAELCCQLLRKGSSAMVVGTLQQQRSTDDEGRNRSHLQVVADRVQFLDRRVEVPATGDQA
jgi:single-strand DNA-binding protein